MFHDSSPPRYSFEPFTRLCPALLLLLGGACSAPASDTSFGERATWQLRSAASDDCGDGILQLAELCDDGNLGDDDGCDATCRPSGVAMASTGDATTCAVTLAGHVKCWGRGDQGQLGLASTASIGDDELPAAVGFVPLGRRATEVYTNGHQAFARLDDGSVRAWGHNAGYELGLGHTRSIGDDESPTYAAPILGGPVQTLAVGDGFSCALRMTGHVECWGRGGAGPLGSDEPAGSDPGAPSAGPTVVELGGLVQQLTAGAAHACVLRQGGSVLCWGRNDVGQLGYGHTDDLVDGRAAVAQGEVSLGGVAIGVVAGARHTCALMEGGAVRCWGHNDVGQLGYGHTADIGDDERPTSQDPIDLGDDAIELAAGEQHTCALLVDGALRCWGGNADGRLGLGHADDIGDDETPASVAALDFGGADVVSVFGGSLASHTCAVLGTGSLRCWGVDDHGQLGRGLTTPRGQVAAGPGTVPDVILIEDPDL